MESIKYWIVRYVPDVAREEFQNIGIICTNGNEWVSEFDWWYLDAHTHRDVNEWAAWFSNEVDQRKNVLENYRFNQSWVDGIRERQANSIQISAPRPMRAINPQQAIDLLYPRLVEHARPHREFRMTRTRLRSEMKSLYRRSPLREGRDVFFRPVIHMGSTSGNFDALQVNEKTPILRGAWAFDAQNTRALQQSIQAWNYGISRLRQDGALLSLSTTQSSLPPSSVITAIVSPPTRDSKSRIDIFEAALEAWEHERVEVLTMEQLGERIQSR